MKSKIVITGILFFMVLSAGCIGNNEEIEDNRSKVITDNSGYVSDNPKSIQNSSKINYDASGYCSHVVDGDTIDVEGVGRIRFVGVNTPERNQPGYNEAKDYVKSLCLGKKVYLDIDNAKSSDRYGRVLAVVYVNNINLNSDLLKKGYAEVMYIPPSEFNPYSWT